MAAALKSSPKTSERTQGRAAAPITGTDPMNLKNWSNPEWKQGDRDVLDAAPKAVLYEIARRMAVCVHGTSCDHFHEMAASVIAEWQILHENGIVPQKPPARLLSRADFALPDRS